MVAVGLVEASYSEYLLATRSNRNVLGSTGTTITVFYRIGTRFPIFTFVIDPLSFFVVLLGKEMNYLYDSPSLQNKDHEHATLILLDKPPLHEFRSEDADQLMAQELNKLSIQEREQVYNDLHGVSDQAHEESPEFAKERLAELQLALDERVPVKLAYELALIIDPDYATNTCTLYTSYAAGE